MTALGRLLSPASLVVAGTAAVLLALEAWRPLRRPVEPRPRRLARNLLVAALAAATVALVERPVVVPLAQVVAARRWGVLPCLRVPQAVELVLAVLLLDYTLWVWHVLTHRVPFLWRFHVVHHADRDMDVSTAVRFHAGEIAVSVVWRAAQVVAIGVSPAALGTWQTATLCSIMFHHSNVRLPLAWERRLVRFVVTPRMHGIHHSTVERETNSNWSSGLTLWDRLHGTLRLDVPDGAVTIGVPAFQAAADVTLPRMLVLPFVPQPDSWQPREEK
ncbi:MAG TPA: sterol desaturase family protein [Candidatus Binatia bacterium]|nr:sterol desaturase family protein [Candidatus Binatia bacterium]